MGRVITHWERRRQYKSSRFRKYALVGISAGSTLGVQFDEVILIFQHMGVFIDRQGLKRTREEREWVRVRKD